LFQSRDLFHIQNLFQIRNLFQFEIYSKFEICSKLKICSDLKFIPISYLKYIYAHLNLFKQKKERENLPVGPNFVGPYGDRSQAGAIGSRKGRGIGAPGETTCLLLARRHSPPSGLPGVPVRRTPPLPLLGRRLLSYSGDPPVRRLLLLRGAQRRPAQGHAAARLLLHCLLLSDNISSIVLFVGPTAEFRIPR
jgi:hypothetical protein